MSRAGWRGTVRAARRAAPALLAGALAVLAAGCQRQPRLVPAAADSALVGSRDSLEARVRLIRQAWDDPERGAEAARLTAGLLLQDLRVRVATEPLGAWDQRARDLLDSLDVGAEVAGVPCAMVVNLFSRGDPSAGSWPWAYWCGTSGITAQEVEGRGASLVAVSARGLFGDPPVPPGPPGIAALFTQRSGRGQQPLLLAWRVAGGRLDLAQTLGPDSLGVVGTGAFESEGDSAVVLATRTWRYTPRFDECATCPHVMRQHRFLWGAQGFHSVAESVVPSPYVTFVQLVQALAAGDRDGAQALLASPDVLDAAMQSGWGESRGSWRVAPGSGVGNEMVFYRGAAEAWKVHFERRGDGWVVESFEPTTRALQ